MSEKLKLFNRAVYQPRIYLPRNVFI